MSVRHLADVTKVGHDVLQATVSSSGLVTAQTGNVQTSEATADDSEWYFPPGVVSLPRSPDAGSKAAQIVAITRGDHDAIVGCRDERVAAIYGQLDYGETAVFASAAGGGSVIFKKDGSIVVTGGTVTIGDAGAVSLAQAAGIADLQAAFQKWSPTPNDGGAALKLVLVDWLAKQYGTTKIKGT